MPDSQDYRDMVAQRFDNLTTLMNAHFETVNVSLDSIKKDTAKTNGRVTEVEDDLKDFKEIANKAITDGKRVVDRREVDCPNIKRFEKYETKLEGLEQKLEDAMFFIRHPKVFIGIIVFFVLASIWTIYETAHEKVVLRDARYDMNATKIEAQQTRDAVKEMQLRGIRVKKDTVNGIKK